jgi:hypothetical protein
MTNHLFCRQHGNEFMEPWDSGITKINGKPVLWESYRCTECGEIMSDEPDGGFDEKYNR